MPGIDAGTFDAEEHEDGDQHRAPDLLEQRSVIVAAEVVGKNLRVESEQGEEDEDQDRNDLGDGDDPVDGCRFPAHHAG